jgi:Ras family
VLWYAYDHTFLFCHLNVQTVVPLTIRIVLVCCFFADHFHVWCTCLCIDVTNRETFENVVRWVTKARREAERDVVVIIVATKCKFLCPMV